ncbi:MAG: c-type cytochrome [Akkermansiaceae bacterium]
MRIFIFLLISQVAAHAQLGYNNFPLGTENKPLILRTFMPQPGLSDEVLAHHKKGARSPKYSPSKGKDIPGEYKPIHGLPAAIGVNYGQKLSYCWDTTECRLMYAWQKGFLDMTPYWGDPKRGNRQSFGYVPALMGEMFYKAENKHPLTVKLRGEKEMPHLHYLGYRLLGGHVQFRFSPIKSMTTGVTVTVYPGRLENQVRLHYKAESPVLTLDYQASENTEVKVISKSEFRVTITGKPIESYQGATKLNLAKEGVNAKSGRKVFTAMGCMACHSVDGSKSHGPSLLGVFGSERKIIGRQAAVKADDDYLLESIKSPNAKVVQGFPENYMPPYQLKDDELKALLIYIKSLKK